MHVPDAAAWATIIGVPIAFVAIVVGIVIPFIVVVAGRQRELRQQLREILFPVVTACNEYQYGNKAQLTTELVEETGDLLLKLSKRDGLKAPNSVIIGQVWDSLREIPTRLYMDQLLPRQALGEEKYQQLLQGNEQWLNVRVLQAGGQAAFLIHAANAIDNYNYCLYRKLKRHGIDDSTTFTLPGGKKKN